MTQISSIITQVQTQRTDVLTQNDVRFFVTCGCVWYVYVLGQGFASIIKACFDLS